jgi:excisionase family DNA binding protein
VTTEPVDDDRPSPMDLISLSEAARRIPSCRRGKKTHLATLYRWISSGRLKAYRRGRSYFVRPEDLKALYEVVQATGRVPVSPPPAKVPAWVNKTLKEFGL